MAAVLTFVLLGLTAWTAVAFAVAVVVGQALRRLEPVPVRVRPYRSR